MSRALVLGSGGLRGAYTGGVVATLGRQLGCDYFDAVYTSSAGAYTASYLVSGQPGMIEAIWRECVHDKLLIRWGNILKIGQPILDLFYLNGVLQSEDYRLSTESLLKSPVKIKMAATECRSGEAHYFSPKTPEEFFLQVRASSAVPYLHPKVSIAGQEYIDGTLSDYLPIEKALADGHDEIIVIYNSPQIVMNWSNLMLWRAIAIGYPGRREMFRSLMKEQRIMDLIAKNKDRVRVILPSAEPAVTWLCDSSKTHINQLVDLGIHDALTFLKNHVSTSLLEKTDR